MHQLLTETYVDKHSVNIEYNLLQRLQFFPALDRYMSEGNARNCVPFSNNDGWDF